MGDMSGNSRVVRLIDVDAQGQISEWKTGDHLAMASGVPKLVSIQSSGMTVGCTFITRDAMNRLVRLWIKDNPELADAS